MMRETVAASVGVICLLYWLLCAKGFVTRDEVISTTKLDVDVTAESNVATRSRMAMA
jgi:hypothetical protein